jgi:hypothetical protein
MTSKLTLSVDKDIVKDVKRLAKKQGTSVSAMFENYARAITHSTRRERPLGPLTQKASGMLKVPPEKSYRQLLEEALLEKYGLQ